MVLEWFAHSCFYLHNKEGKRLLMDPYYEGTGYTAPSKVEVEVVTSSHAHRDHDNFAMLSDNGYALFQAPGVYQSNGFTITGIESYHDDKQGTVRGDNVIFVVETDNLRFCHLGDLGHVLTQEQAQKIGKPDVLMIPVGGHYTIDAKQAVKIVNMLSPTIVLPMHYYVEGCRYPIAPVDEFLQRMQRNEYAISMYHDASFPLEAEDMPRRPKVYVLEQKY